MNLNEIGEFGFIKQIRKSFDVSNSFVTTAIGDDCSVHPFDEKYNLLVTKDLLVEDIHFDLDFINPWQLGYKSLAVNLSDIAAMGGQPLSLTIGLAVPPHIDYRFLIEFYEGMQFFTGKYRINLAGGDTTKSPDKLFISITVIGKSPRGKTLLRSKASAGDLVIVDGYCGDSAAGLFLLQHHSDTSGSVEQALVKAHLEPRPHLEESHFVSKGFDISAMIDQSDGLLADAGHIAEESGLGLVIDAENIPISDNLAKTGQITSPEKDKMILTGGEDYNLIFTVSEKDFDKLNSKFLKHFGRELHIVGSLTKDKSIKVIKNGKELDIKDSGFNHFTA